MSDTDREITDKVRMWLFIFVHLGSNVPETDLQTFDWNNERCSDGKVKVSFSTKPGCAPMEGGYEATKDGIIRDLGKLNSGEVKFSIGAMDGDKGICRISVTFEPTLANILTLEDVLIKNMIANHSNELAAPLDTTVSQAGKRHDGRGLGSFESRAKNPRTGRGNT